MARREADWLRQGERDLAHAKLSREAGNHEWACYAAHQAAEKAVKAFFQSMGADAWGKVWGKSATALIAETTKQMSLPENLVDLIRALDHHNLATRYPDAHPQGAPMDFYTVKDAADAIAAAGEVVQFVRRRLTPA